MPTGCVVLSVARQIRPIRARPPRIPHSASFCRSIKNVVYEPVPLARIDMVDSVTRCALEPLEGAVKILGERQPSSTFRC